ncbi:KGK domain-containing protein [Geminocystis sp. NIES-3708]|uniref:KGK domain-containing protein n=1 Tax=Geminocystis sp. NIES-3708 TaxID=1615909 RepID=UPI000835AE45|nr:KGK domain-containing protein [Geminocystis sp. NIES-3708]
MTEKIELLNSQDVISVENDKINPRMPHKTFKVEEFTNLLAKYLSLNEDQKEWLNNGVSANVLVAGKLWRKGKVRLCVDFIPDEAESPLDEFRK